MSRKKRSFLFLADSSDTVSTPRTQTTGQRRGRCLRWLSAVAFVRCVVVVLVTILEPYHHHEGVVRPDMVTILEPFSGGDRHGRA